MKAKSTIDLPAFSNADISCVYQIHVSVIDQPTLINSLLHIIDYNTSIDLVIWFYQLASISCYHYC